MNDSIELYKKLSADFKAEKNYYFSVFGEGMMQGRDQYYADSDDFGMTDDDEINVFALIDKKAHILVPSQPMHKYFIESAKMIYSGNIPTTE